MDNQAVIEIVQRDNVKIVLPSTLVKLVEIAITRDRELGNFLAFHEVPDVDRRIIDLLTLMHVRKTNVSPIINVSRAIHLKTWAQSRAPKILAEKRHVFTFTDLVSLENSIPGKQRANWSKHFRERMIGSFFTHFLAYSDLMALSYDEIMGAIEAFKTVPAYCPDIGEKTEIPQYEAAYYRTTERYQHLGEQTLEQCTEMLWSLFSHCDRLADSFFRDTLLTNLSTSSFIDLLAPHYLACLQAFKKYRARSLMLH